jgi:hypothetical protein
MDEVAQSRVDADRISTVIEITQEMLSKLKNGLLSGEPLEDLAKVAREISIATTSVETLIAHWAEQSRNKAG